MDQQASGPNIAGIDPDRAYPLAAVAQLVFGKSSTWFTKHRRQLEGIGFPMPVSPRGRPRWRGWQLYDWYVTCEGKPEDGPTQQGTSALLRQRAIQAAHGGRPRKAKAVPAQPGAVVIPFRRPSE